MWSPNELLKIEKQRDILSYITLQFFHFKKVPLEHCPFGETYLIFCCWDYFATVPLRWGVRGRLQSLDCSFPICFCPDYT